MSLRKQSVLHITEAFASGTLEAIRLIVSAQKSEGADVAVLHGVRPDSPPEGEWDNLFPTGVVRHHVQSGHRMVDLFVIAKKARRVLRQDPSTVVHVHSTYAAAAVRLLLAYQSANRRVVYSPHGFAFLRQDLPTQFRSLLFNVEKYLSKHCGALMLVSASEAELTKGWLPADRISVVENAVNLDEMPLLDDRHVTEQNIRRPLVVTMGRVTYQKAPWKFAELARKLGDVADFVWIGDGAYSDREKWFADAPVQVTGWLSRTDVASLLASSSLFVLPSLWEGMPLALIEAQCLGLPAVASRIVGNSDVILHGTTGFLAEDDHELLEHVRNLVGDPILRSALSRNALEQRHRFAHERLGKETLQIYDRLLYAC